jgi:hypothetical protein
MLICISARRKMHRSIFLFVGPLLIRPEIPVFRRHRGALWRKLGLLAIECSANHGAIRRCLLERRPDLTSLPDQCTDAAAAFGGEIPELHAALAIHRDSSRVGRIGRLGAKLDGFTGRTQSYFEPPAWTLIVGIVGADDNE